MRLFKVVGCCGLLAAGLLFSVASHAELILSAPPRESIAEGQKLYGPLADYLSKLLGQKVSYHYPGNWLRYQVDMRHDRFDIVFDGPHFASWRIKYYQHTPLVKLPDILKFYLVALAANDEINEPEDLAARRICVIPPPNLSALVLLDRLDGPAREPVIEPAKGGMKTVYKELLTKQCDAAMMRSTFFDDKLDAQQRKQLKIIYTSPEMPNQVITVSKALNEEQQRLIVNALVGGEGVPYAENIVRRFTGNQYSEFVPVLGNEYQDYSRLLEGVILGWKRAINR